MKALVISGGGNRGAAGAGKLARINQTFDVGVGVSTGSLMLVPALLGEHRLLRETYTTIKWNQVLDENPFNKKGNLRILFVILKIISGSPTLTTSSNLLKTIRHLYIKHDLWYKLQRSGKRAYVGVYNDTAEMIEYKCSDRCTEEEWITWTWVSACQPPVMSIYDTEGKQYMDGGVVDVLPMEFMSRLRPDHITVIAHRPKELVSRSRGPIKNLLHHACRLAIGMRREISNNDLRAGKVSCRDLKIPYDIHYCPEGYYENDLVFDQRQMTSWWNQSYHSAVTPEIYQPK